jgi:hypothetical protein
MASRSGPNDRLSNDEIIGPPGGVLDGDSCCKAPRPTVLRRDGPGLGTTRGWVMARHALNDPTRKTRIVAGQCKRPRAERPIPVPMFRVA